MRSELIRLLIVEVQPEVRRVMHMRLAAETDIFVIGEAADAKTAMELATTLCPDVVLVDVDIPGRDGLQMAAEIHRVCPDTAMIVLSINDDALTRQRVKTCGACTLVGKSMPAETLLAAIRDVAAGAVVG